MRPPRSGPPRSGTRAGAAAAVGRKTLLLVALLAASVAGADAAPARGHHHHVVAEPSYIPPYADIVIDDNSGEVLHETHPDEPRHPASLTKIMTLYLLFEQLEAGALTLDTPLPISPKAAQQHPTKLGLKPNETITVEDAIGGIVTRSANDAAVVVSEAIGGSEEEFAKLMTAKAHELGMTNTTYVNASGLPADEQITTARDQAILGRAVRERFPRYFVVFGRVEGVDGIKTGYTDASGYNLVSSVHRNDKYLVAVVLGETSNSAREARMRALIEDCMRSASALRTAPAVLHATGPGGTMTGPPSAEPVRGFAPASAGSRPVGENFEQ